MLAFSLLALLLVGVQACVYDNVTRQDGEEWVVNTYFLYKCTITNTSWSIQISGCNFNGTKYNLNESKDSKSCESLPDGRVKFNLGPICDGKAEGQVWDEGHFRKTCDNGLVRFVGCQTEQHVYIPIGEEKQSGNFTWRCESTPGYGVKLYPIDVDKVISEWKAKNQKKAELTKSNKAGQQQIQPSAQETEGSGEQNDVEDNVEEGSGQEITV